MSANDRRHRLFLLLGSNIDPERHLPEAVTGLVRVAEILAVSQVWESAPVGFTEQANFLNVAVHVESTQTPAAFRAGPIADIERRLHRVRDPDNINAPRTIDIDILRLGDGEILTRAFIAVPLAEIAPDAVHETDGRSLAEIAAVLHAASPDLKLRSDVQLPARSYTIDSDEHQPAAQARSFDE